MVRVMFYDAIMISTWAVPEVQVLGLWSPTVRPVLTVPGVVCPNTIRKTEYEPYSTLFYLEDGRTRRLRTLKPRDILYRFSYFNS